MTIPTHLDPEVFAAYLDRTRWFGGKGRPYAVTDVRTLGELPGGPPLVVIHLVEVTYSDAEGGTELYQVPLAFYARPRAPARPRLRRLVGGPRARLGARLRRAARPRGDGAVAAGLRRRRPTARPTGCASTGCPGHELDLEAHSTLFSGEQSNSSVAFGEDALMKVFRKVTPGVNPDIEVHEVLTRAGSDHVAALYGWLEASTTTAEPLQLAMLQQFLRTATDGWDLALASVRTLFADPEVHAHDSGGDFAGESTRLGEALREVHEALREHFPAETRPAAAAAELAADHDRPARGRAGASYPSWRSTPTTLRATFDAVAELDGLDVQQVHGDLHLGQTLRTSHGWKIVDFEGEPAKPLAERQLPDSPWRDVAGMLRSFDYAARVVERSLSTSRRGRRRADRHPGRRSGPSATRTTSSSPTPAAS